MRANQGDAWTITPTHARKRAVDVSWTRDEDADTNPPSLAKTSLSAASSTITVLLRSEFFVFLCAQAAPICTIKRTY